MADEDPLKRPVKVFKLKHGFSSATSVSLMPGDRVAVADRIAGAIKIVSTDGETIKDVVRNVKPYCVTSSRSGLLSLTHRGRKKDASVQLFTADGQMVGEWGQERVWHPRGIACTNRARLVVTELNDHQHAVGIYTNDGNAVAKCRSKDADRGNGFKNPLYVAVDVYDRILVSDRDNHCVKVFDPDGRPLMQIGVKGRKPGCLYQPYGVATDAQGNIMVSDTGNRRICVFTSSGRYVHTLLTSKTGLGFAHDLDFSREGRLVVANHVSMSGGFHKLRAYDIK